MTELSPNTEVVLSSDLLNDDPCLENMSASAIAVLDAYMAGYGWLDGPTKKDCRGVAAALRVAADQSHPKAHIEDIDYVHQSYVDGWKDALDVILAVADELEAQ